jgi:hypothetical protein
MPVRRVCFRSSAGTAWPWSRQLPVGPAPSWGASRYAIEPDDEGDADWLVIYDGWASPNLDTHVPLERRIFITGEPASVHRYDPAFLAQFGTVITTQRAIRHPGVIHSQIAGCWFAGVEFATPDGPFTPRLAFEDLVAETPRKTRLCSVICSDVAATEGHRQRLRFVEELRQTLGDRIDFFGHGRHEIRDKDEGLAAYRFHIVVENSRETDYWSEKLADAFLRGCFPLYSGCPNVGDYFPGGSYVAIDTRKPREAIAIIRAELQGERDRAQAKALEEARRRVLWEHNVFALLERTYTRIEARGRTPPGQSPAHTLGPERDFEARRVGRRARVVLQGLLRRRTRGGD